MDLINLKKTREERDQKEYQVRMNKIVEEIRALLLTKELKVYDTLQIFKVLEAQITQLGTNKVNQEKLAELYNDKIAE